MQKRVIPSVLNVTFWGGGSISRAMASGLLQKQTPKSPTRSETNYQIRVVDPNEKALADFLERTSPNVQTFSKLDESVTDATDVIVLAIKPQTVNEAVEHLAQGGVKLRESSLLISVVTGLSMQRISEYQLGTQSVVRAMPNMPAAIGQSFTVWTKSKSTTEDHVGITKHILSSFGKEEFVRNEKMVDIATAVSGSGPAYVLLMLESMVDGAGRLGMDKTLARELAEETLLGTVEYAKDSQQHTALLRSDIVSPGGTTAAALHAADRGRFRGIILEMMFAAFKKTKQLQRANSSPLGL